MQKDTLRKLQLAELQSLVDFHEFCAQHGLQYYLIGGALLGAIRYQRFIPWDDDIDVAMPREDYERIQELWKTEGAEGYFLQSGKTDERFSRCILKIRKNGTHLTERSIRDIPMHDGIYIDIFPIDYLDSVCYPRVALRAKVIRRLMSLRAIKNGYENGRYTYIKRLIKSALALIKNELIDDCIEKLCRKENHLSKKMAILFLHNYSWKHQLHQATTFGKNGLCSFEGHTFSAPENPDAFLKTVFGPDYMQEPAADKQIPPHQYVSVVFEEG